MPPAGRFITTSRTTLFLLCLGPLRDRTVRQTVYNRAMTRLCPVTVLSTLVLLSGISQSACGDGDKSAVAAAESAPSSTSAAPAAAEPAAAQRDGLPSPQTIAKDLGTRWRRDRRILN